MQIKTFPGLMNTFIDCDICVESTPLFLPSDRAPFNIGLLQSLKQYYSTVNNQPFVMLTLQKQCTSPSHPTLIWYQKKSGRGGGESGKSKIDVKPLCIHSCFLITNLYYFSDVWELSIKLPTLFSWWCVNVVYFSIQLTALKRPLVVTHDLFNHSIMDISW